MWSMMADESQVFPDMNFEDLNDIDQFEGMPSEQKWTYMIDFEKRRLLLDEDGRPKKTETYEEYLIQICTIILNTERFQYVIYDGEIGVEKSEWPAWEDLEIKRDIEEALEVHSEIVKAEVLAMERAENKMHISVRLTGLSGMVETEVEVLGTG